MKSLNLNELDSLILKIEQEISLLSALKPANLEEQKEEFFKSGYTVNPQFVYKKREYPELTQMLSEITVDSNEEIAQLYLEKIESLKIKINFIESIGQDDNKFINLSEQIFGKIHNDSLITSAEKILTLKQEPDNEEYLEFDEIFNLVQERLNLLGLDTTIIVKEEESMRFHVDHHNNKIFIPKNTKRTRDSVDGMLLHEINTHLLRAENGKKQKFGIFFLGTTGYLPTEEGLAVLMGHFSRKNKILSRPAKLFLVMNAAIEMSFADTFNYIYKKIRKPKASWNLTLRVKRGIMNTERAGAFTKDQYFKWAVELAKDLLNEPSGLNYVFNGKATLKELMKYTNQSEFSSINTTDIKNLLLTNAINV